MNIESFHDLVLIAYVIGAMTPVVGSLLIFVINRYLKNQDTHNKITMDTLTELKIITQVHEVEIENLKDATFIVRYPKTEKI